MKDVATEMDKLGVHVTYTSMCKHFKGYWIVIIHVETSALTCYSSNMLVNFYFEVIHARNICM